MDFITALNQNATITTTGGIIKHTDLAVGAEYPIKRMHKAKTIHGNKLVVITAEDKSLFLPARYSNLELNFKQYKPMSVSLIKQGEEVVRGKVTPLLVFKPAQEETTQSTAATPPSEVPI